MMILPRFLAVHGLALLWCFALPVALWAGESPIGDASRLPEFRNIILFERDTPPEGFPLVNPYNTIGVFHSAYRPVLDHTGQPHKHGHVIQIIADGGNGIQDPPNPDGSPGGDDSLAYGNCNMIRILGIEDVPDSTGRTGLFYPWKGFIPYMPDRAYYLRLWEGKDVATAPYYQDTVEYDAVEDRGGAMIRLRPGPPLEVEWRFGPSKPRPKPAPKK